MVRKVDSFNWGFPVVGKKVLRTLEEGKNDKRNGIIVNEGDGQNVSVE